MSNTKHDSDASAPTSEDEHHKQQEEESYESLQNRIDEAEEELSSGTTSADDEMRYPLLYRLTTLKSNIAHINNRISAAKKLAIERGTHTPTSAVTLIAVSKLKPSIDIAMLHNKGRGQLDFGENYMRELQSKSKFLPESVNWHYIGALQTGACKSLARIPNLRSIHSLDSLKKAGILNKNRPNEFEPIDCYIQINTSGEESKSGLKPGSGDVTEIARELVEGKNYPRLRFKGLMTIGALARSQAVKEGEENEDFECLVKEAERVKREVRWEGRVELSMGMSEDFEGAIVMGATCVRVGSSIFGARPVKKPAAAE